MINLEEEYALGTKLLKLSREKHIELIEDTGETHPNILLNLIFDEELPEPFKSNQDKIIQDFCNAVKGITKEKAYRMIVLKKEDLR